MRIIDLEQGSPEWLEFRKNKIGASDIPSIMGVGFKTPWQLYMTKKGLIEDTVSPAMIRGLTLESEAREWCSHTLRTPIKPIVVQQEIEEWAIASLDGITMDGSILEIKVPGQLDHDIALKGVIPLKYQYQMAWQRWVSGATHSLYNSYRLPTPMILQFDGLEEEEMARVIEKAREFYECLVTSTPPAKLPQDKPWDEEGLKGELSREGSKWSALKKECEERLAEIKSALISEAGGVGLTNDWVTLSWKEGPQRLDVKALEKDGIDLSKYRTQSEGTWSVRFKRPEE